MSEATPADVNVLDLDVRVVFENDELLHRVIRAIALDQGVQEIQALEQLHKGIDANEGTGRLGRIIERTRSDVADVEQTLMLLEQRDAAVNREYERALGPIMLEQTNEDGLVLLDQSGAGAGGPVMVAGRMVIPGGGSGGMEPLAADVGKVLADPQEFERRLARIRAADPLRWDGEKGRQQFRQADREHAEAGLDLVRTAERPREIAAAQQQAERVGKQLDKKIGGETDKRHRLKVLDAEIATLEAQRTSLSNRNLLSPPANEHTADKLRLLDADERYRETGSEAPPILSTILQGRVIDRGKQRPDESYAERRRYVLETAEPGVPLTLEQETVEDMIRYAES